MDERLEGFFKRLEKSAASRPDNQASAEHAASEPDTYACAYCGQLVTRHVLKIYAPLSGCWGCTTRLPPLPGGSNA
jgi:hypothetical protein